MRRVIFAALVALLATGCRTVPTITPGNAEAVTETQAAVASGTATVAAGASQAAEEAQYLVVAARGTGDAVLVAQAERHAETTGRLEADAKRLAGDADAARKEIVSLLAAKGVAEAAYQEERAGRVKAEGQRNTARAMLAGIIAIAASLAFLKFKRLIF
jgi:hypothetical protein